MESNYMICIDHDGSPYLAHAWGKHKYIRIENGRYIYPKDIEKVRKNNYLAAKEQQRKTDREMNKAVKAANKNYKALKKAKDNYKGPENKYNLTKAEKAKEKKIAELNEKAEESIKKRANLKTQSNWNEQQVRATEKEYEKAQVAVEAEKKYKKSQRRRKAVNFMKKIGKLSFSKIDNPKL